MLKYAVAFVCEKLISRLGVWILIFVLYSTSTNSQNCNLDSPINLKQSSISATAIQRLIEQHRTRYTQDEVVKLRQALAQCQLQIDRELTELQGQSSNMSLVYQDILGFKDVAGLKKTIADLKESRKKSKEELEQNLSRIKHFGLFVVLLKNIDTYAQKQELTKQTIQALTTRAVEDLNGNYIKRFSEVKNYSEVSDIITSMTSGEVYSEKEYVFNINFKDNYCLYAGKIGVTPLKKALTTTGSGEVSGSQVLNIDLDKDWQTKLRAHGVSQSDIEKIINESIPYLDGIRGENENATIRQERMLESGQEKIAKIDRDIADTESRLANRNNRIREYCAKYNVSFDETAIEVSVQRLLDKIRNEIETINKKWNTVKERDIVSRETRHTIEGNPAESIASEVVKLVDLLRAQYRTVQKMEERVDIENLQVTDIQTKKEVQIYREIEQIWVYPIPREDGSFGLYVFARFKITDQKASPLQTNTTPSQSNVPPSIPTNTARHPDPIQQLMDNMVVVQGGTFTMGCTAEQGSDCDSDEKPTRRVTLSDYHIGRYEVTQAQWRAVMGSDPQTLYNKGCDQCPVENVSWEDVHIFIGKLSAITSLRFRLPTEAEWEYAARGGSKSRGYKYSGSNDIDEVVWYKDNAQSGNTHGAQKTTRPVGQKKANELGLYDLSGNVWEWCSDWFGNYISSAQTNPTGPSSGSGRVNRGGSWLLNPQFCRVSYRNYSAPANRHDSLGFRLARS